MVDKLDSEIIKKLRKLRELKSLVSYVFVSQLVYNAWYWGLREIRAELLRNCSSIDWDIINNEHL